jgi:hypothetical protein
MKTRPLLLTVPLGGGFGFQTSDRHLEVLGQFFVVVERDELVLV